MWRWVVVMVMMACGTAAPVPSHDIANKTKTVDTAASKLGTWRIPVSDRGRHRGNVLALPGTERFAYDGSSVTLYLFTEKEWMWRRPDDIYRLEARWVGNELQYRPPFGTWSRLATWTNDRYENFNDPELWIFERVDDAMKDADDRKLDEPRPLHDYTIKPMDRYTP